MKKSSVILSILLLLILFNISCKKRENLPKINQSIGNTVDIRVLTSMPIEVGDPIDIVLSIIAKSGSKIDYPRKNKSFYPFILKSYDVKRKNYGKNIDTYIYYTLTSLYSGKIVLPPLTIIINNRPIYTKPIEINVQSTILSGKKKDINDIEGPLKIGKIFIFLSVIIILMSLFLFLYRKKLSFFKKRKRGIVENKGTNITYDPILTSILSIFNLEKDSKKSIKDKYYLLSSSLKKFLGVILNLNLMPLTTNRIKKLLQKYLSKDFYIYLSKKLDKYDEIKYSKKTLDSEYKKKLKNDFTVETDDILNFLYRLLKNYYKEIFDFMV